MKVLLQHEIAGNESKYQLSFDAVFPALSTRNFNESGELCDATRRGIGFTFYTNLQMIILQNYSSFFGEHIPLSIPLLSADGKHMAKFTASLLISVYHPDLHWMFSRVRNSRKSSIQINSGKLRFSITWTVEDVRPIKVEWKQSACWVWALDEYLKLYIRALNFQFPSNFGWQRKIPSCSGITSGFKGTVCLFQPCCGSSDWRIFRGTFFSTTLKHFPNFEAPKQHHECLLNKFLGEQ